MPPWCAFNCFTRAHPAAERDDFFLFAGFDVLDQGFGHAQRAQCVDLIDQLILVEFELPESLRVEIPPDAGTVDQDIDRLTREPLRDAIDVRLHRNVERIEHHGFRIGCGQIDQAIRPLRVACRCDHIPAKSSILAGELQAQSAT